MLNKKRLDKKLKEYIKEHLGKGYARHAIRKVLAEHGYNEAYISGLLKKHSELQFVKKYAVAVSLLFVIAFFSFNMISGMNQQKITGYAAATNGIEQYFALDVTHNKGFLTFNSIGIKELDKAVSYADKSGFLVKAISLEGAGISAIYYNMSESRNYIIYIPYNKNAARIEVYNLKNSKVMDIEVASFSETCGNQACEGHESYESCTSDCASGSSDGFCDKISDGICDPDCNSMTDADCIEESNAAAAKSTYQKPVKPREANKPNYLMLLLSVSAVILFVLFLFLVKKRRDNRLVGSLSAYINENLKRGFTLEQIKSRLFKEGYKKSEVGKALRGI